LSLRAKSGTKHAMNLPHTYICHAIRFGDWKE
jgi:hypothetical protein